jgi:hypothetical protein
LKRKKITVSFWDISQFYKQSLDRAAKFYLNEGKQPMPTKSFSRSYVKKNWMLIAKYCLRDADLTARLGRFLVDKLEEFGVIAPSLYSCASISYKYFSDNTKIVTAYDLWQNDRKALAMAVDSYEGGKFEITARGSFDAHEYDLTSAYPYEISNLIDISNATIEYSNKYIPSPPYGFLRVIINNPGYHLPCGIMQKGVRIYPNGTYETTITKQEYEYLKELSISPKIMEAVYFHVEQRHYPYRNIIDTLYKLKSAYKNKDTMLYNVTKIIQNSFYGKMAQCITLPDKSIRLGSGFNPIYASVITANTRIKVCRIQNKLKDQCLAVHTDSVITTCPINLKNSGLGEFEHVVSGKAIIIACGMYQINNQCAFKGFSPTSNETWETILSRPQNRNRKRIPYPILNVESWVEAMAKNHPKSKINLFNYNLKTIDLNPDTKRIWSCNFKARDFLTKNEQSMPLNFFQ